MANPHFGAESTLFNNVKNMLHAQRMEAATVSYSGDGPALTAAVWSTQGDVYWGCPSTETKLAPGFYRCGESPRTGPYLQRVKTSLDNLLRLPDPVCDLLLKEFVEFWKAAPEFGKRGLIVKRGIMLWGPPGSGKTSAVAQMSAHMIKEMDGIVVIADRPDLTTSCLHMLRQIEPHRPLIVMYEDMDALVQTWGEPGYLALLDGENQIGGIVNVATTNYPERLDKRFVDRPGRFDRIVFVDMPAEPARRAYFKAKVPDIDDVRLDRWVKATHGYSLAHLRELVVATQVLGDDEQITLDRLDEMRAYLADSGEPPEKNMAGLQTLSGNGRIKPGFGMIGGRG